MKKNYFLIVIFISFFVSLLYFGLEYSEHIKNNNRMEELFWWPLEPDSVKEVVKILEDNGMKSGRDFEVSDITAYLPRFDPRDGKCILIRCKHILIAVNYIIKSGKKLNFIDPYMGGDISYDPGDITFAEHRNALLDLLLHLEGVEKASVFYPYFSIFEERGNRFIIVLKLKKDYKMPDNILTGICHVFPGFAFTGYGNFISPEDVLILNEEGEFLSDNSYLHAYTYASDAKSYFEKDFLRAKEELTDEVHYHKGPLSENVKISIGAFITGVITLIIFLFLNLRSGKRKITTDTEKNSETSFEKTQSN